MKKILTVFCAFLFLMVFSGNLYASEDIQSLKDELKEMQTKIEKIEKESKEDKEEIEYMSDRLDKAELHTTTDKISMGIEFRTEAQSIQYNDMQVTPAPMMKCFMTPQNVYCDEPNQKGLGLSGLTKDQIMARVAQKAQSPSGMPVPEKYDEDNDVIFTNKFHLNMKAKINNQLNFAGRLAAYKVWGDSTGVKFYQGNLGDVTFDGNTSSLPHGDTIRLERAYFVYSQDINEIPVSLSLGRRPSTYGPPLEYANYSLEAGTPFGTIINWQFDGASLTFGLDYLTGIPGASLKLCYGVGFEGDWGNSYALSQPDVEDVHLFGFVATLFDDGDTNVSLNYAHAWDITDGFTGITAMPFIPYKADNLKLSADGKTGVPYGPDELRDGIDEYYFEPNSGGFISRMQPATEIGDWDAATLLLRRNLYMDIEQDIDIFLAGSWSHTNPSSFSGNPLYDLLDQGLLSTGELDDQDGYSIFAGVIFPMPYDAKLGLEYNWGSKYWFNFTGAEDTLVGSKLATRGSVYEGYYIQPIIAQNFFVRLGTRYYNYKYTGSGNPMGAPVRISEVTAFDALMPVADKVWDSYLSATLRF